MNNPRFPHADGATENDSAGDPAGKTDRLSPQHRRLIDSSGISPEVAAERGYRTVTSKAELGRLGFSAKQCRVPALLVPIHGVGGETILYQIRPDEPRIDRGGKPLKYETPGGARMALDVPPRVHASLGNPSLPLFITEGVRKADAAASRGLVCVALLGVWNWRGTNEHGGKTALADWEAIALNDRDVYIVFDSDITVKPEVRMALDRLAPFLGSRKANPKVLHLPAGEGGRKIGLDDYLAAGHTVDDLLRLAGTPPPDVAEEAKQVVNYEERNGGIVWLRRTSDGQVPVPLTNYTARIVSEVQRDDGAETTRAFELEARLGSQTSRATVPAARFSSMNWPMEHLGAEAVTFPGQSLKDHARVAVQLLSGSIPKRTVFTHTGWRTINEAFIYLHAGGAIGPEGLVEGVDVELPPALASFRLEPPPLGSDLQMAIRASLDLVGIGPDRVMLPILSAVYRSVLGSADCSIHLSGRSGAFKTEIASRAMQHFGRGFIRTGLPGSWSSTGNSLEALAFVAKDALLVVDDFCPTGSPIDVQRAHREADRLFRAQGNNSGRGRLSADGTLRPAKPPRGFILSTGEDVPRGLSLRARMLVIEIGPYEIDVDMLTEAQESGASGLYAAAMAGYLRWLAPKLGEIRESMRTGTPKIREAWSAEDQHRRTPGTVADLFFGFRTFIEFAEEAGAITADWGRQLLDRARRALREVASEQAEHQTAAEPTARFLELIRSVIGAGGAHVANSDGSAPEKPGGWGWRERTVGSGEFERTEWQPQGSRIGWLEGESLYLDRDAAHRAAQVASGLGGDGLAISAVTLVRRLAEKGFLVTTDSKRKSLLVRRVIEGKRRYVAHLTSEAIYPSEDLPNSPTDAEVNGPAEDHVGKSPDDGCPPAHEPAQEVAHAGEGMGNSVGNRATEDEPIAHGNSQNGDGMEPDGQVGQADIWEGASITERARVGFPPW